MQRRDGAFHRSARQAARRFQPVPKLHGFGKTVEHHELIPPGLGDQHAATVGAKVKGAVKRRRSGRFGHGRHNRKQGRVRSLWTLGRHVALQFKLPLT
jgi:hypothetical protein